MIIAVAIISVVIGGLTVKATIASDARPKFFTLPFLESTNILQNGWIYSYSTPTYHKAIDYVKGTLDDSSSWQPFQVVASADGYAQYHPMTAPPPCPTETWGNFVRMRHSNDSYPDVYYSLYAHLDSSSLPVGQEVWVSRGDVIGIAGSTGDCQDELHLHLEFYETGYARSDRRDPYDIENKREYYPQPDGSSGENYGGLGEGHVWLNDPPSVPFATSTPTSVNTVLFWGAGLQGSSVPFAGYGKFNVPNWFNDQASSMTTDAEGVVLYEHADQGGGYKMYTFNQSSSVNLTGDFNNGTAVNDNVSSLWIAPLCAASTNQADQSLVSDSIDTECIPDPSPTAVATAPIATATPPLIPTPTSPPGIPADAWKVNYFRDTDLQSRCHDGDLWYEGSPYVIWDWGDEPPIPGCYEANNTFSARFWRHINFQGGQYSFYLYPDDQARIRVDGNLVVDHWDSSTQHEEGSINIPAGSREVVVEYRNTGGRGVLEAWWSGPGFPVMPHDQQVASQWYGEYWGNRHQWESPIYSRNEGNNLPLVKEWGMGGLDYGLPADHFSTKFARDYEFSCGSYQFILEADDTAELTVQGPAGQELLTMSANNSRETSPSISLEGEYRIEANHREEQGAAKLFVDWQIIDQCPTSTSVPPTATATRVPPTLTFTPMPPTATNTNTPVPATPTNTNTPVPPTSTFTPAPPTATDTNTPVSPTAPNAPSNVTASAISHNAIRVNWTDNSSNETGFRIWNGNSTAQVGSNITTYTETGIPPETYTCYQVQSYNTSGSSAWSPWKCATTLPKPSAYECDSDTVSLWRFDDGSGSTATDACGRSTGSLSNTYSWISGRYEGAIKLGQIGSQGKMTASSSSRLNNAQQFTNEFWINRDCASTNDFVMGKTAPGAESWVIGLSSSRIEAEVYGSSYSTKIDSGTSLSCNTWHHVALTYDGVYLRLYIDNSLKKTIPHGGGGVRQTTSPFIVSGSGLVAGIDEIRISDKARSSFPAP